MNELNESLDKIKSLFEKNQKDNQYICEINSNFRKVTATVKTDLERAAKNPVNILDAVIKSIDALREVTPYFSIDSGTTKVDPPLTEEEKESFRQKFNEKFTKQ